MVGEGQEAAGVGDHEDDLDVLKKSKSSLWPFVVALVLVAGGVGGFLFMKMQERVPLRVLVAINSDGFWWEGSTVSAQISDELAEQLNGLGFEAVNGGDPEVVDKIARASSAEEAAKILKAGFLVTGDLTPKVIELPVKNKYTELRVDGPIEIAFMDEPKAEVGRIQAWSGALKKERAMELLGRNLGDQVFQRALAGLMGHKHIRSIMTGDNAVERGMLTKAESFVELRDEAVGHALEEYKKYAEEQLKNEGGGLDIKHHTGFRSEDLLCEPGDKGVLVQRSRLEPYYDIEERTTNYFRGMEELVWVNHDGKEVPVTTAYNLFSYATGHPSGFPVVYIEDLYGWAKSITVAKDEKTVERLRVDPEHRYLAPHISPDKKLVAVVDRKCRRCDGGILVLEIDTKKEVLSLDGESGEFGQFEFAGNSLFYLFRPASVLAEGEMTNPKLELRRIDFSKSPPENTAFFTFEENERASSLAVGENGKWLVTLARRQDGPQALIFDAQSAELEAIPAGWGVKGMSASPTAKQIVYENRGEIWHFDLVTQKETQLTKNARRDRYPYFSSDGKRVYFEGLGDDPNFRRKNVSAIASVATPKQ